MNREGVGAVVLALVAILAVAFVSATLTSVVEPEAESGGGGIGGEGSGPPGEETTAPDEADSDQRQAERQPLFTGDGGSNGFCVKELQSTWIRLAIVLGIVAVFLVVKVRLDTLPALGVVAGGVPVLFLLYGIMTCGGFAQPSEAAAGTGNSSDSSGALGSGSENPVVQSVPDAPVWLFVLVGVLAVAVAVVAVGSRGSVSEIVGGVWTDEDDGGDASRRSDVAAVGRVAGRAADRIETGADAENEVFRAWQTMTEYLDVDRPDSSTPAEFAAAAVDIGLDSEAVGELTAEFEAVRYGGESATAEREERAVAALRRIEADAERVGAERDRDGPTAGGRP